MDKIFTSSSIFNSLKLAIAVVLKVVVKSNLNLFPNQSTNKNDYNTTDLNNKRSVKILFFNMLSTVRNLDFLLKLKTISMKMLSFLSILISFVTMLIKGLGMTMEKLSFEVIPVNNLIIQKTRKVNFLLLFLFVLGSSFASAAEVDLALSQTVSSGNFKIGDPVTYTVKLTNQGNTTATNIVVEDIVPIGGLTSIVGTSASGSWTMNPVSGIGTWTVPTLAGSQEVILTVTGNIIERGVYFNIATIKSSPDTDIDSVPGNYTLSEDDAATSCFTVPLLWYVGDEYLVEIPSMFTTGTGIVWYRDGVEITPTTQEATVNPDYSLSIKGIGSYTFSTTLTTCPATGCCAILVEQGPIFDLALRKSSVASVVVAGGQVTYNIEIFNQGNQTAKSIQVADYVPTGLTLSDPKWIVASGIATLVNPIDSLAAGKDSTITITFNVSPSITGNITNGAEISSAKGPKGEDIIDEDSTPDNNPLNDGVSIDDEITQNGKTGGDEDDSDFATVTVTAAPVFDLALRKTTSTTGPLYPGSMVTFKIDVFNQGTMMATNVKISDYVPTGLTLADANWTMVGNRAETNNPNFTILAGNAIPLTITFKVNDNFEGTAITNSAEISAAKGPSGETVTDIDSYFDTNPLNDGVAINDVINQNGKTGGDEDDSDFSTITITPLGSIGNFVFADLNQNGIQDPTELGINAIVVTLEKTDGTILNYTNTDANGKYTFTGLLPGNYVVGFGKPAGYTATIANQGLDSLDSDADVLTGKSPVITLASGQNNMTIDAGFYIQTCADISSVLAASGDICSGDSTNISAISANGAAIKWYLVPSGGTALTTTNSGSNFLVYPTTTTVYYAQLSVIPSGCSTTRTPLAVVVNQRPLNPSCGNVIEICIGEKANLNDHIINGITTPGGTFEWHTTANPSSPLVSNPLAVGAGKYYLFEKSGAGCFSNPTVATIVEKACDKIIDLSLLKTANKRTVNINDIITYTILINNAGPDAATNVQIKDILPAGLLFVSSSDMTHLSSVLTKTIPTIAAGQTITLTYLAKAISAGTIINVAEIIAADQKDSDSTPGNGLLTNEDDDDDEIVNVVTPNPIADLSIKKLASNSTPNRNDNIVYTISVSNAGPNIATNVEVRDILPSGLTLVSTSGADQIITKGDTVIALYNSIPVNSELDFTITAKVTGTGSLSNRAEITKSDQLDPDSTPNTGSNEDDDATNTITIIEPCNPTTPIIATATPFICSGESATLSAVGCNGTISWSNGMTGNMITVSPTTNTVYNATCKVGLCESPISNNIQIVINAIAPPTIASSSPTVCAGGSVTLTATGCTGTVTWSNAVIGASIEVVPASPSSSYTATCKQLTCTSGNSNTVTVTTTGAPTAPSITANKTSICAGESVVLTANGCAGTVNWSNSQTGASITVSPVATSNYTATCSTGSCMSPISNMITVNVGSLSAPTITASNENTCGGEPVTLTVGNCTSGILWSNNQTTASITVTPTATTTYSVTCGTGTCAGTASKAINVGGLGQTPTLTASKTSICVGDSVTFTATSCSGTLTWSLTSNTTTVLGTGNTLKVKPITTTSYTATCATGTGCKGYATISATVAAQPIAPVVTSNKQSICAKDTIVLTAFNCEGVVNWSNGVSGSSITVYPIATTTYTATCTVNGCVSPASIPTTITVTTQTPIITASANEVCAGGSVTLTASACTGGTLLWSTGETTASITKTINEPTTYKVTCTASGCVGEASKAIGVGNGQTPVIAATKNNLCAGESTTLSVTNCTGAILWSTGSTLNTITVSPLATTAYSISCGDGSCKANGSISINVNAVEKPIVAASKSTICAGQSTDLTVSGCSGGITWSNGATSATITVSPSATKYFSVSCGSGACVGKDSVNIIVSPLASPTIAANRTSLCAAGDVVFTATGCTGTVNWSNGKTGASMTATVAQNTTFTATCDNGTCTSTNSNSINVTVGAIPAPTITSNGTAVCNGSNVTLTASNCATGNVLWSNGMTGTQINVSPVVATDYTAVCRSNDENCQSTNSNIINIKTSGLPDAPTITCSASRICQGDSLTLTGIGCAGTVVWHFDNTTATGNTLIIKPNVTTVYTATCKVGACESISSGAATITVGKPIAPIVTCNQPTICSGSSTTIEAAGCVGTVKWSNGMEGSVITVSPTVLTTYSAICDAGRCQSDNSNSVSVVITGNGITAPKVSDLTNVCPLTSVDLTTSVTSQPTQGGSFVFRTGNSPTSPIVATPTNITTTGTFYVFESAGTGCFSPGTKINVGIVSCEPTVDCSLSPATAYAGKDTTLCLNQNFIALNGNVGGSATSSKWTTTGAGTFENSLSPITKYYFAQSDIVGGTVTLTLTTNDPDNGGPCTAATSKIVVNVNGVKTRPVVTASKSPIICLGDSVTLTASPEGAYTYLWSNGKTTKSIVVKTPGIYTVKFINTNGCSSLPSEDMTVNTNTSIVAPTVIASAANTCPATTVDLNTKVTSTPSTQGGAFEFRTSDSITSPMLATTNAVTGGTYYVFEKTITGCYSPSAAINVTIDNCNVQTGDADIQVSITANKTSVVKGDTVVYTIIVKNNGPSTATNVKISNKLPSGLEIVGSTPGLNLVDGNLEAIIPSLAIGATKTYVYTAKLIEAGLVANVIDKVSADQNDPVTSNNTSKVEIECSTCQASCIATALKADTLREANGSFNIKFTALIKNCGNIDLTGVELENDLASMFPTPSTFTVVQKPTPNATSGLVGNDSYNGSSDISILNKLTSVLAHGKTDTVVYVINLIPNGKEGPFSTNAIAKGLGYSVEFDRTLSVSDVSNNGSVVVKDNADPTVVKLYKSPSIALSLAVKDTVKLANGSYDIKFQATVLNNGSLDLAGVVISDTLSKYFRSPASYTVKTSPSKNTGSALVVNPAFNGSSDPNLTLIGGSLAVGKKDTICFTINLVPETVTQFENQAIVKATGTLANGDPEVVTDISNSGYNPSLPGSSPTQLILGTTGEASVINTCVGVALSVSNKVKENDGSFTITYQAILKNCGNLALSSVSLCDTLSNTFNSPTTVKVVGAPTVGVGSTLVPMANYDGVTNTCLLDSTLSKLASEKVDTVRWQLNILPNSNNGPFKNNVTVTSKSPSGQIVTDISNDGINPSAEGSVPTILNFNDNIKDESIGLAKQLVGITPVPNKSKVFDVEFKFVIKNFGIVPFPKVELLDNLSHTFGNKVMIDSVYIKSADAGLVANANYTGKGDLINILVDSLSSLPVNTTRSIGIVARVDLNSADTLVYENIAMAVGHIENGTVSSVDDASNSGLNPDEDQDGTPANDSKPTVIDFTGLLDITPNTPIGVAKAITDTVSSADGSYLVTYTVIVKNFGQTELTKVQLVEDLADVFSNKTQFALITAPTVNTGATLKVNPDFDGDTDKNMLIDSVSTLAAGQSDTLVFKVKVANNDLDAQTYKNIITATAYADTVMFTDKSTEGMNPDKNVDGNPGNDNVSTDITIAPAKEDTSAFEVLITNGISPDGNSSNDVLVIKDKNNTDGANGSFSEADNITVYIYNRWGHMVYQSENYVKDFEAGKGWDATSNLGVRLEKDKYVSNGTYYYVIASTNTRLFGGKPVVGYITVQR
jgi:large repetitive protein